MAQAAALALGPTNLLQTCSLRPSSSSKFQGEVGRGNALSAAWCVGRSQFPSCTGLRTLWMRQRKGERPLERRLGQRLLSAVGAATVEQSSNVISHDAADEVVTRLIQNFAAADAPLAPAIERLRGDSTSAAKEMRWPRRKDEEYRFTDLKALQASDVVIASADGPAPMQVDLSALKLADSDYTQLVIVDGVLDRSQSCIRPLPAGVVVSSVKDLTEEQVQRLVTPYMGSERRIADTRPDLFSALNGAGAKDAVVIYIPENVKVEEPIHIVYVSSGSAAAAAEGGLLMSNPRCLVVLEKGAEAFVAEDFAGRGGGEAISSTSSPSTSAMSCWTNQVLEVFLSEGSRLDHAYVQAEEHAAFHIKATIVSQETSSVYSMVEARLGGRLSRHNLHVEQLGAETVTSLSSFLLCGRNQLHDLHSRIVLRHPRGRTQQLHKCIVTDATGHGVFDGNVQVHRLAQETDAGQLSRNLLLVPRATVNVRPNLQIVADSVKCTHGATISDLEEDQLFYFRTRGIDAQTARSALVFSFGAEVVECFLSEHLRRRVQRLVIDILAAEGVMDPTITMATTAPTSSKGS